MRSAQEIFSTSWSAPSITQTASETSSSDLGRTLDTVRLRNLSWALAAAFDDHVSSTSLRSRPRLVDVTRSHGSQNIATVPRGERSNKKDSNKLDLQYRTLLMVCFTTCAVNAVAVMRSFVGIGSVD